jgi:hypothetical protein
VGTCEGPRERDGLRGVDDDRPLRAVLQNLLQERDLQLARGGQTSRRTERANCQGTRSIRG